jgi:Ni/Co efflux regulator RcnB
MTIQSKIAAALLGALVLAFAGPAAAGEAGGSRISDDEKRIIERFFDTRSRSTRESSTKSDSRQDESTQTRSSGGTSSKSKDKGKGKGKGQAQGKGKKQMPKGIAMKLERGGTLPPGIERTRMPEDLARELPKRPADQELTIVDDNVVLMEKATGRILDIFKGARR